MSLFKAVVGIFVGTSCNVQSINKLGYNDPLMTSIGSLTVHVCTEKFGYLCDLIFFVLINLESESTFILFIPELLSHFVRSINENKE